MGYVSLPEGINLNFKYPSHGFYPWLMAVFWWALFLGVTLYFLLGTFKGNHREIHKGRMDAGPHIPPHRWWLLTSDENHPKKKRWQAMISARFLGDDE